MKRNFVTFLIFYIAVVFLTGLISFVFAGFDTVSVVQASALGGNPNTPTPTYTSTPARSSHASSNLLTPTATPVRAFFLLTVPLASKPYLGGTPYPLLGTPTSVNTPVGPIGAIVWNSLVDHTPPFYEYSDLLMQPYTGELAPRPTDSPPVPTVPRTGPGAYGETSTHRNYYYNSHPGLDLRADTNLPVYATHAGKIKISSSSSYGTYIYLQDAENTLSGTFYAHLSNPLVADRAIVARGQLIAMSGNTGAGTGPHLHFGVYQDISTPAPIDDQAHVLDPYSWFSYNYDRLRQRTPTTNEFLGIPPLYKWASGYPPTAQPAPTVERLRNWNLGAISGNQYIPKSRSRSAKPPVAIGRPPTVDGTLLRVHPIERAWTNNYGSIGAPYEAVFVGGEGRDCQYFEGGTFCDNGQTGYTYSPRFTDVPLDFWANRYIGWVGKEEIAQGYLCGGSGEPCDDQQRPYFRPNANMTRSQFAKVVSNLFTINDDPGGQIYEDVPLSNPFYTWINRLSNRGIMGGYPCGSNPFEPCVSPLNRPYFRPGANITKGQAAKILANTATQPDMRWLYLYSTDDGPDFNDTPRGSEFYSYVELLYKAGVVQYRLEDPEAPGQGGKFYPNRVATRAEISQLLHELAYAAAPAP